MASPGKGGKGGGSKGGSRSVGGGADSLIKSVSNARTQLAYKAMNGSDRAGNNPRSQAARDIRAAIRSGGADGSIGSFNGGRKATPKSRSEKLKQRIRGTGFSGLESVKGRRQKTNNVAPTVRRLQKTAKERMDFDFGF